LISKNNIITIIRAENSFDLVIPNIKYKKPSAKSIVFKKIIILDVKKIELLIFKITAEKKANNVKLVELVSLIRDG
tara:strand:- start:15 stop:242 length:228 start_codon:yes stop_codon:yes gene_type:complete